jgi:diol dehydratase reactivase alpha subunit
VTTIAGVDVGNNSTEVAVAEYSESGGVRVVSSALVRTVGIKGTIGNAIGVIDAIDLALQPLRLKRGDLDLILLNEATPVIGDVAMETITETVITESAMIGHNPGTPGGGGLGVGTTVSIDRLEQAATSGQWIVIVPGSYDFQSAASRLNAAADSGLKIVGAVVQKDDAVLIHNRLYRPIPIVDEVRHIDRVPLGMTASRSFRTHTTSPPCSNWTPSKPAALFPSPGRSWAPAVRW